MQSKVLANGTTAYATSMDILEIINEGVKKQMYLDSISKFHPNDTVTVSATKQELTDFFILHGEMPLSAKNQAIIVLGNETGTVLAAHEFDNEEKCYTIEMETIPLVVLPERFLQK